MEGITAEAVGIRLSLLAVQDRSEQEPLLERTVFVTGHRSQVGFFASTLVAVR